jgi:hypothetical protein
MFLVYRRVESDDIFTATSMKKTFVNRQDSVVGYRSDRPDGALSDVIYKNDIVDYRHKILTSGKELDITLQQSVSKLVAGELTTALKRGFGDDGDTTTASSGGGTLMKVERINGGADDIPNVGTGSGVTASSFKRRAFCNAEVTHDHNVIEIPHIGAWAAGETFDPEALLTLPDGEIVSVDGFYDGTSPITDITPTTPCAPTIFTVGGSPSKIIMEFTFRYASSTAGFKDVPKEILEACKGTFLPIATRDNDVPLRFNNTGYLLNFGINPGVHDPGEIDSRDFLRYRGGNYTEKSYFGHEMILYRTTDGAGDVTLTLIDSMLGGYYILGVKSVELQASPGVPRNFTVARQVTTSPYAISEYTVTATGCLNVGVRVVLYVGSKFIQAYGDTYSIGESLKFFETNKQGRGVIDTYEMIEAIAVNVGGSNYVIDTGDKPLIAFATVVNLGGTTQAFAFKYNTAGSNSSIEVTPPTTLPVLSSESYTSYALPTRVRISAASTDAYLRVPVLVHSYVAQSETPYNFYYKTNAYQGLLISESIYGKIVDEGPVLITSMGSGAVTNYSYSTGTIPTLSPFATMIIGSTDTKWLTYARSGDYLRVASETKLYRILSITNDNTLALAEQYIGPTQTNINYQIIRLDVPGTNISNVVDRMPSLKNLSGTSAGITDHECYSDDEMMFQMVQAQLKGQDPILALTNDFKLGNTGAERGRNDFRLTMGVNDIYKLSSTPRPHIIYESTTALPVGHYKKVYQIYLFNRSEKGGVNPNLTDLTGRMYMLVISGEKRSSTENMLDGLMNIDTIDLFEMVGRPLIKFD